MGRRVDDTLAELGEEHAPTSFLCPISQELMRDPVVCADGHSYDRKNIARWLRAKRTSPKTGLPLEHITLTPNHALRNSIEEFMEQLIKSGRAVAPRERPNIEHLEASEALRTTEVAETPDQPPSNATEEADAQAVASPRDEAARLREAEAAGRRGEFGPLVALIADSGRDETARGEAAGALSRLTMPSSYFREAAMTAVLDATTASIEELVLQTREGSSDMLWSLVALWGLARSSADHKSAIAEAGGIAPLVELTRSGNAAAKEKAAAALANLAADSANNKAAIAEAGGIVPLVELAWCGNAAAEEKAAAALASLAFNADNAVAIAAAGGIAPLVELARSGSAAAKENAEAALQSLAVNDDNALAIAQAGGIAPLVQLARSGTAAAKEKAAGALATLAVNAHNAVTIAMAGGIALLVELARSGTAVAKGNAAAALATLAVNADNKVAIAEAGGIVPLVELTRSGNSATTTGNAAGALSNLAANNDANKVAIAEAGGIVPLVELTRSGTAAAKGNAAEALATLAVNDDNAAAIAAAGGVASLIELTINGNAAAKESAVVALSNLAVDDNKVCRSRRRAAWPWRRSSRIWPSASMSTGSLSPWRRRTYSVGPELPY